MPSDKNYLIDFQSNNLGSKEAGNAFLIYSSHIQSLIEKSGLLKSFSPKGHHSGQDAGFKNAINGFLKQQKRSSESGHSVSEHFNVDRFGFSYRFDNEWGKAKYDCHHDQNQQQDQAGNIT